MTPRHRAEEFRRFLNLIDTSVPAHLDVHVVLDNSSTHKTPSIQRWLVRHPRFTFHFTPTYSSWLNLVERWFAELTTKWIKRGATAPSAISSPRSAPGSPTGTTNPNHSSGTRAPTRSWTASPPTASGSMIQDTSGCAGCRGRRPSSRRPVVCSDKKWQKLAIWIVAGGDPAVWDEAGSRLIACNSSRGVAQPG